MERLEGTAPILIVNLSKREGGADTRVLNLAAALQDRHITYAVATLKDSPMHKLLIEANLTAIPIPFFWLDPRILFALLRIIRQHKYKVVDVQSIQSVFWGVISAQLARVPSIVVTAHGPYGSYKSYLKGRFYEWMLLYIARLKGRFIAVSESVREYLQETGIKANQIFTIYNSIRWTEQPIQNRDFSLRESLGWGRDSFVLVTVGRLEPEKGYNYLIDALSIVVRDRPQIRCLFVGKGQVQDKLEAQVKRLQLEKWVHFAGFQKDVKRFLNSSDAFCMPSVSEGLPYALMEACAYRLPLLVTEVGEMAKLLTNGKTAIVVPPENPEALAKGLIRLVDSPKENATMGNAAFEFMRNKLSIEEMVDETLKVYNLKTGG